jgi:hypothetical protein
MCLMHADGDEQRGCTNFWSFVVLQHGRAVRFDAEAKTKRVEIRNEGKFDFTFVVCAAQSEIDEIDSLDPKAFACYAYGTPAALRKNELGENYLEKVGGAGAGGKDAKAAPAKGKGAPARNSNSKGKGAPEKNLNALGNQGGARLGNSNSSSRAKKISTLFAMGLELDIHGEFL